MSEKTDKMRSAQRRKDERRTDRMRSYRVGDEMK